MRYLVGYDVADDRRRQRAAEVLLDYGRRVQESVFECLLDGGLAEELRQRLRAVIAPMEDKVLVVALCGACEAKVERWGTQQETDDPEFIIL